MLLGDYIPRQEAELGHAIKLEVKLSFLQYPGLGPIEDPPKHIAFSVGHVTHYPGDVYCESK